MTNYFTRTFQALNDFILAINLPADAAVVVVQDWVSKIESKANDLPRLITAVQDAQKRVSKAKGVGSTRLGLRLASINPRGPFEIPAVETALAYYEEYKIAAKALRDKVVEILDEIQGDKKERAYCKPLLEAMKNLLAIYGGKVSDETRNILDKFRVDLDIYVNKLDVYPAARNFLEGEPDPNSSYWPSSFIVSSSSSSSLPPPP